MKPITQTKFYPEGSCVGTCIASILEIHIDNIPNDHSENWAKVLDA